MLSVRQSNGLKKMFMTSSGNYPVGPPIKTQREELRNND
jgi:hypothetical protein